MGSSPNLALGWVQVPACGFKSHSGFCRGLSPSSWVHIPNCILATFRPLVLSVSVFNLLKSSANAYCPQSLWQERGSIGIVRRETKVWKRPCLLSLKSTHGARVLSMSGVYFASLKPQASSFVSFASFLWVKYCSSTAMCCFPHLYKRATFPKVDEV